LILKRTLAKQKIIAKKLISADGPLRAIFAVLGNCVI
jgi:hypothetical protein